MAGGCCDRSRRRTLGKHPEFRSPDIKTVGIANWTGGGLGHLTGPASGAHRQRIGAHQLSPRDRTQARLFGVLSSQAHVNVRRLPLPWSWVPASASFLERRCPRQMLRSRAAAGFDGARINAIIHLGLRVIAILTQLGGDPFGPGIWPTLRLLANRKGRQDSQSTMLQRCTDSSRFATFCARVQ